MNSELTLQPIPFVDGLPSEDQKRLSWIINGDCLDGAEDKLSSSGSLNRVQVQLQKNINVLVKNQDKTKDKVNVIGTTVATIEETLGALSDTSLIELVNKHDEQIIFLTGETTANTNNIDELIVQTSLMADDLGVFDPATSPIYRTVRGELLWQKLEMGNYPGQDVDGREDVNNPGHGMKGIIMDSVSELVDHRQRIIRLEDDWSESDVGQVVNEVRALRKEVGPAAQAGRDPLYTRVKTLETKSTAHQTEIDEIKEAIDFDSGDIAASVRQLSNEQMILSITIEDPVTGLRGRTERLEAKIGDDVTPGTIEHNIKVLKDSNNEIRSIVGESSGDGLQKSVAVLNAVVGIVDQGQPVPNTSILYKLDVVDSRSQTNTQAITDLQTTLGAKVQEHDEDLDLITNTLYGDAASSVPLTKEGVVAAVARHDVVIKTSVINPPDETYYYVRQGSNWIQIPIAAGRYSINAPVTLTSTGEPIKLAASSMTPETFNRGLAVKNDSISVIDKGPYKLEAKLRMAVAHVGKKFQVLFYINGENKAAEYVSFESLEGGDISTSILLYDIKETDLIDVYIKTAEVGDIVIDKFSVLLQPI